MCFRIFLLLTVQACRTDYSEAKLAFSGSNKLTVSGSTCITSNEERQIGFADIVLNKKHPMKLWEEWYMDAKKVTENTVPEAMSMSTVQQNGHPAARTLIVRGYDYEGFKIYTDYTSPKATELAGNNWTALVFLWSYVPKHETKATGSRQVRVEGYCSKLSLEENIEYFKNESVESQVRSVVQRQSQCIDGKRKSEILNKSRELIRLATNCPGYLIDVPEDWGGYKIHVEMMEFYQSAPFTIGDRVKFIKKKDLPKIPTKHCRVHRGEDDWVYEYLEA